MGWREWVRSDVHADDPGVQDFPATVYRFYSRAEVTMFLQSAGFTDVVLAEPILPRGFVIASATRC